MIARLLINVVLLLTHGDDAPWLKLPAYPTRYYTIYTDLDRDQVQEASVHITRVAEVYANRTRDFSGVIRTKLPFVLYRNEDDYIDAGGVKGSAGLFTGKALIAIAGEKLSSRTWHVVQHEGFHQFAAAVIGGDIPTWVNEGLAEYFGEGVFTGDDLITGIVPEWRRKRIINSLQANRFKTVEQMMHISLGDWNAQLSPVNYDQAWSMIQFLAHGDGGKYQTAFNNFMRAISKHTNPMQAWRANFGAGSGFEERWRDYWTKLPPNPSDNLYRQATVSTLTSFVARAYAAGQNFESMPDFAAAASAGKLNCAPEDALPKSLLAAAMTDVGNRMKSNEVFLIEHTGDRRAQPRVVVHFGDDALVGEFVLREGRVDHVTVNERRGR